MPLVKGDANDTEEKPRGRIRNTKKLLVVAALIMSGMLVASSFITTLLIPVDKFRPAHGDLPAGEASGRALAYLAHESLGGVFGSVYDVSTILILWFAGASAMAGLLNIVPRYLPRYGDGAGLDARDATAGHCLHHYRLCHHPSLQSGC